MAVIFSPLVNTGFSLFSCFFLFTLSFPARIFFQSQEIFQSLDGENSDSTWCFAMARRITQRNPKNTQRTIENIK